MSVALRAEIRLVLLIELDITGIIADRNVMVLDQVYQKHMSVPELVQFAACVSIVVVEVSLLEVNQKFFIFGAELLDLFCEILQSRFKVLLVLCQLHLIPVVVVIDHVIRLLSELNESFLKVVITNVS